MKKPQTRLFNLQSEKSAHGGNLRKGRRKTKRPFIPKQPMHVVLRSSKARGELSFLRSPNYKKINLIVIQQAKKHFVKLCEYVNVGNHLHLKVKAYSRKNFQAFLISVTALIARIVTGAKKGQEFGKFWDALAYSRVLRTHFEERVLTKYFDGNAMEVVFGKEIRDIFLGRNLRV